MDKTENMLADIESRVGFALTKAELAVTKTILDMRNETPREVIEGREGADDYPRSDLNVVLEISILCKLEGLLERDEHLRYSITEKAKTMGRKQFLDTLVKIICETRQTFCH